MNKSANTPEIGIVVPTMNRPDFVIRQLNYYASLNFPHTIYYSDGSSPENAKKIKVNELISSNRNVPRYSSISSSSASAFVNASSVAENSKGRTVLM